MIDLEGAIANVRDNLEGREYSVKVDNSMMPRSCCAHIDSQKFVGTVTVWPDNNVEIQINNAVSGEVAFLETRAIETEDELSQYLNSAFDGVAMI